MTSTPFRAAFQVTWADLDPNDHLANSAYLDYATQARMLYLAANGFTPADFRRLALGPVVFSDTLEYRRELRMLDAFTVDFRCLELNEARSKFTVQNRFHAGSGPAAGELAATVTSRCAWWNVRERRITAPPPELAESLVAALVSDPDAA